MSAFNQTRQAGTAVAELLSGHSLDTFRRYWALYERAVAVQNVQAFYLKIEPEQGYCNFAVVGDGKVVDVEGDDSNGSGGISIRNLSAISGVAFYLGSLTGFPRTQGASLVAVAKLVGETASGPYWAAWTEDEERQLVGFARVLIVANSGS